MNQSKILENLFYLKWNDKKGWIQEPFIKKWLNDKNMKTYRLSEIAKDKNPIPKKQKGVFELVGPITDKTYMAWVTRPEDTDLRDYISSKILEMRDKGLIDEIQDKWFGFRMPIPSEGHLPEGAL